MDNTYKIIAVTGKSTTYNRGQGGVFKKEFETFEEAKQHRQENNSVGNLHIKMPDGSWWPADYKNV